MGSYKKKLFIVLLLFLLISFFVCSSVNAAGMSDVTYTIDQPTLLKEQQEYLASIFLRKYNSVATEEFKTNLKNWFNNVNYWPLFVYSQGSQGSSYIFIYFIPSSIQYQLLNQYTLNTNDEYFEDTYMSYPVSGYQFSSSEINVNYITRFYIQVQGNNYGVNAYTNQVFIPSSLIMYQNKTCINFINGINPTDSSIAMIINAIQENTEEQEEQTQEMKKLNDFMSNEDVDENAYDMPTDNPTQDITESGINGIFTMFYDKIDNWESENITIRIPFANKIFIIPSNLTENIINSYFPQNTQFGRLLGLIWYYLLGVYIVKDIQKYIDGLQTGEILTKSDTNIKTEML